MDILAVVGRGGAVAEAEAFTLLRKPQKRHLQEEVRQRREPQKSRTANRPESRADDQHAGVDGPAMATSGKPAGRHPEENKMDS